MKNKNIYQGCKDSAQTFSCALLRKCSGSKVNAANNILIADIYLVAKVLSFEILYKAFKAGSICCTKIAI